MKAIYLFNRINTANCYGIGQYIKQIVETLIKNDNYEVNQINLFSQEREYKVIKSGNYILHEIPIVTKDIKKYYLSVYYLLISNFDSKISQRIFHFNYSSDYFLANLIKNRINNIAIIFTVHYQKWCLALDGNLMYFKENIVNNNLDNTNSNDLKIHNSYIIERNFYNISNRIICLNTFIQNVIISLYKIPKSKLHFMRNCLDDHYVEITDTEKRKLREKYSFSPDDYIIIFAGRLNRVKGIQYLIESMSLILKDKKNVRLIIAGDGDFGSCINLARYSLSRISFFGYLDKDDLYNLYQISDLGILPSFHEQSSYTMIEMMMFCLPIVITDSTALNEVEVPHEMKINIKYKKRDASIEINKIKDAIIYAINNKEINKVKYMMRETYIKKHSNVNLSKIRDLYNF